MATISGEYIINNPFDWSIPRKLVRIKNSAGVFVDISDRVISASVTLNSASAADTFTVALSNYDRYISTNFTYAREIEIGMTFNQFEQEILLTGRIDDPEKAYSKSAGAVVTVNGKDWTVELQNRLGLEIYKNGSFTAETNPYIGEIVRDLIQKYCPSIDASEIPDTEFQIEYKIFLRQSIFYCIKWCADLIGYRFYVNTDRKLIFEPIPESILIYDEFTGSSGSPENWTVNSGTWEIANNEYQQTNTSGSHVSYRTIKIFTDLIVDALITINSGTMAGVALRIDGSGNHYYVALDLTENLVKLYRSASWGASDTELNIGGPSTILTTGMQYHMRIYAKSSQGGALFHVFLDDMFNPILTYLDETAYTGSGKVGLRTKDTSASFDNFMAANAYLIIEEAFNAEEIKVKDLLSRQKNNVFVEGGYEKFPWEETVTPSGDTDVIDLEYAPSETRVDVTGAEGNPQKGGIKGIDDNDETVYFLVDYWAKKLYRRVGNWDNVVTTINYNKNVALLANEQDPTSFDANGVRDIVMTDKLLNTQALVEMKAAAILNRMKIIPRIGTAKVAGVVWGMNPGDYVLLKSPSNEIDEYTAMAANSITISFSKEEGLVYSFSLNEEDVTLPLLLNSIEARLQKVEHRDMPQAPIHIETIADSVGVQDTLDGEQNESLKLGHHMKLGHNLKLSNASSGWSAAF